MENPSKMETNELPEEVKRKIDEEADNYGFVVPYDGSNQFYKPNAVEGFQAGAEFGYRLGLQSKEEELAKLKFNVEVGDARIQELSSEVEKLKKGWSVDKASLKLYFDLVKYKGLLS